MLNIENVFGQTDLNTSKRELNKEQNINTPQQEYTAPKSAYRTGKDLENEITSSIAGNLFVYLIKGMVGNYNTEDHLHNRVSKYPYRSAIDGNYTRADSNAHKGFRMDIEDHFLYGNKDLHGNHLKAKFRPFEYFYFQTEMFQLFQYDYTLDKYDNLLLYNLDFCYDRLRYERFNLGFTLGANYIANDVKKGGFAFGFNTEIFVTKPISLYASVKWSGINANPVNTFELQGKYHIKNFYISAGYQHMRIASPSYRFVAVGLGIYL
ncbi:MAG: hypothetical protein ACTHJT_10160 [Cytophaga sp.]|uniref:hypothetical protein n=1 Tax=Cytophaga sp. TaxID=29535 RepID=UPI003F7F76EA